MKRKELTEKTARRNDKIFEMRFEEHKTLQEIAKEFNITHQRVQQILGNTVKLGIRKVDWECPICKKILRLNKSDAKEQRYCSIACKTKGTKFGIRYVDNPKLYLSIKNRHDSKHRPDRKTYMHKLYRKKHPIIKRIRKNK